MPEEPEIETAELREKIHEEMEREGGGPFLKSIALTTALLAVFAAVASLRAGGVVLFAITVVG